MIQRNFVVFTASAFFFLIVFFTSTSIASQDDSNKPSKAEVIQKTKKLQIPFVANNGQVNGRVKFYANTFGGTVFVTKDGEIVYALPNNSSDVETQCLASLMHSSNGMQDNHVSDIMHPASWIVGRGSKSEFQNLSSTSTGDLKSGVAIKETLVGGRVQEITGNEKSVTNVNYFKGKDPSKWKTNISTYDMVSLGDVYDGIELKLKAYGNNVEKLFCVKPGADPQQIKVRLSGVNPQKFPLKKEGWRGLSVNEHGELEVETELGPVKFTKPIAYQEIDGKRVEVSVEYGVESSEAENKSSKHKTCNSKLMSTNPKSAIHNPHLEYGFTIASYDKTKDLIIDPLLASTFLGGSTSDIGYSLILDTSGNVYVTGRTSSTDFPTTSGAYDTSSNGSYDVFVSKLDSGLTTLLASTYLGGSGDEEGYSLTLDTSGNVYVAGYTNSSDFPTTNGAYDTSHNSVDVFISKLDGGLTTLLASTYLGGSLWDWGESLTLDTSGNVYVTGITNSTNFPTTSEAYDTSRNGGTYTNYVFVSKLNSGLTSLLASTYLGGSGGGEGYSLTLDTSGNIYVAGYTGSTDFPTTSGAYDTSYSGGNDVFISKLNSGLTTLLASTYLSGGSYDANSCSLALDTSGNVYVTGNAGSGLPTTSEAYDTSYNGGNDVFISKLDSGLTSLLASTYLGGSGDDYGYSLALDTSGNVYVTGSTSSTDFPTTSEAYDTSRNREDIIISKLDSGLTSLLASTYLGGSVGERGYSLTLDTSGNVYVTGYTTSSDFPTTSGAYDTSSTAYGGNFDVFVSKLDSNLSVTKPTATTSSATNVTTSSATLNGTVNANRQSTMAWFQYDTTSGAYTNTSSTQTITGSSDTTVSININDLSPGTTYYYRIAAQSSVGTAYGSETSFTTLLDTATPTGSIIINSNATYTNSPNVTLSLSASDNLSVTGYYLSTSSSTPSASDTGWTSVTSTNSYSSNVSYTLSSGDGDKTVYVWFKDNSGNVSSISNDSIILDTTAPTITITSPTSNSTYTVTSSVIAIGGNASDSTSGVSSVTWSNNKGGSGTASGTTGWLTSSISLLSGDNVITVTAKDGAGNSGTDTLQVTYSPSGTVTAPSASTGSATNVTSSTAILNGTVNANGASTTVWFQYGTASGSYGNTSSSQVVSGSSNTAVSTSISGLSSNTTYYYRIVASNSAGTSYGSEVSFATKTASTTPTPTTLPAPTLSPLPTPQVSPTPKPTITLIASPSPVSTLPPLPTQSPSSSPTPIPTPTVEPGKKGSISGYVIDRRGNPIESAKIRLKAVNTEIFRKTISDEDGVFGFEDLDAGTYVVIARKMGYKISRKTVKLKDDEDIEIEIKMKKQ